MRIAVLGGGPGGLYFASMWKDRHPRDEVQLFEQNPAGATWGFGVVFSDRALEFLREDDPETVDLISPHMETWRDITIAHRRETITIDGIGFSAIGRLELLKLLQKRALAVGVDCRFEMPIRTVDELAGFDLIVAADGVNSLVRRAFEGDFGFSLSYLANKFIWYGTTRRFDTLTHTFVETDAGSFNAHHYRYAPAMSTFLVECDRPTWLRAGFDKMSEEETRRFCEGVFAKTLQGSPLVSNRSFWRSFPWIWNERWSFRNMVLIGDSLRTAHFSIGSGTRLALEDALALVKALQVEPADVPAGLARYEATRRPIVEKLVAASRRSGLWYERFADHMQLAPLELAMSYITRSERIDADRLRSMSPGFMALYTSRHALPEMREPKGEQRDAE
ncbi:MAG: monooxygenase [Hyphomicrobiaceae bacterium]|nr:MAG: monooxygenase [Hyphomicrobiaceae bacterium]